MDQPTNDSTGKPPAGPADETPTRLDSGTAGATGGQAAGGLRLAAGTRLGTRYEIAAVLGEGGMGTVYRAHDRELQRDVALKVIRPDMAARPEILERFKREILLASRVTHKHVLRIHDLGEAGDLKFISMQFVEGENLKALLQREGPLPVERALPLACQIAEALEAAHEAGVVHRDLKPQNILIDRDGNAFIADFGISRSLEAGATMTETGTIIGTVDYMSPEQARGETPDHRGDIYSLGVILYEIFTGTLPFRSDNPLSVMMKRVHQDAPTIRQSRADIPVWLSAIVARAMQRDPAARYQSAGDLLRDLDRRRASIAWRRLLVRAAAPALAAAIVLGAGSYYLLRRAAPEGRGVGARPIVSQSVAFLPFENGTGNPAFDWVRSGFPDLLAGGLRDLHGLRVMSGDRTHQTLGDLKLPETGAYSPFDLKRAAAVLGADVVVTGVVRRAGDLFQAEAHLRRPGAQGLQEAGLERAEGRGEESIFTLADTLAGRIAHDLKATPAKSSGRRPATRSVEALRLYAEALDLSRAGRDLDAALRLEEAVAKDAGFAQAQALLSQAYDRLGQRAKAQSSSDAALKSLAGASDHEARFIRARNAVLANRLEEGIAAYRQILDDWPDDVDARFELGGALEEKGDLAGAAAEFERTTALDPRHLQAVFGLGRVRSKLGENEAALKIFNDMLATYTQAGNEEGRGRVLNALGNVALQQGLYPEALARFRQAVDVRTAIGDRGGMAVSLGQIASVLRAQGRLEDAVATSRKALDLRTQIGDQRGIATEWRNLGEIYEDAGRIRDARSCYEESLKIVRDLDDRRLLARNFSSLGYVSSVLGDYVQAYFFYQEALAKRREIGEKPELLRSLIDLELMEQMQGRYDKALAYSAEAMDLVRETGEKAGGLILATNVGLIHDEQGSYAAALASLSEAVEGTGALGDKSLLAYAQLYLGATLVHIGRLDEGEEHLREAERLVKDAGSDPILPELLVARSQAQAARGEAAAFIKTAQEALRRSEALGDHRLVLLSRLELGCGSLAAGRADGAAHLAWVSREAGKSALQSLKVRALACLAAGSGAPGDAASAHAAEQALEEGGPLRLRESLVLAARALARRARAQGRQDEATRYFLQAGQLVREMAEGLDAPRRAALLARKDLADLRREALGHISRHGTAADRGAAEAAFPAS